MRQYGHFILRIEENFRVGNFNTQQGGGSLTKVEFDALTRENSRSLRWNVNARLAASVTKNLLSNITQ